MEYLAESWARGERLPSIDARGTLDQMRQRLEGIRQGASQRRPDLTLTHYDRTESVRMYAWSGESLELSWSIRQA